MPDALSALRDTYFSLNSQIDILSVACTSQAQRDALNAQLAAAQKAYYTAVNQVFANDDAQVATLTTQLNTANTTITNLATQMGDMTSVLNTITSVVALGAKLAALATG